MFVMMNLTLGLVIIWGWDVGKLDTSFETPYWRVLQVILGCLVINIIDRIVLPNYCRLNLRKTFRRLVGDIALSYVTLADCYADETVKAPSTAQLLKLQTGMAAQTGVINSTRHEWCLFCEPSKRNPNKLIPHWQDLQHNLAVCAANLHALRLPMCAHEVFSRDLQQQNKAVYKRTMELKDAMKESFEKIQNLMNKPDIAYATTFSLLTRRREGFTPEEYSVLMKEYHDSVSRALGLSNTLKEEALTYVHDVALTKDDVLALGAKLKERQEAGLSLDQDGDGDFDADDVVHLLTSMLEEQKVTDIVESDKLLRDTLRLSTTYHRAAIALAASYDALSHLGPEGFKPVEPLIPTKKSPSKKKEIDPAVVEGYEAAKQEAVAKALDTAMNKL